MIGIFTFFFEMLKKKIEWLHLLHRCHRCHLKQPWLWDKQDVSFRQLLDHVINQNRQIFWIKIKTKKTGAETNRKRMPTKRKVVLNTKSALNNFFSLKRCCNIFLITHTQTNWKYNHLALERITTTKDDGESTTEKRSNDPMLGFLLLFLLRTYTHTQTQTKRNRLTPILM